MGTNGGVWDKTHWFKTHKKLNTWLTLIKKGDLRYESETEEMDRIY